MTFEYTYRTTLDNELISALQQDLQHGDLGQITTLAAQPLDTWGNPCHFVERQTTAQLTCGFLRKVSLLLMQPPARIPSQAPLKRLSCQVL